MDFSGLPLGHLDQVALAVHDILHQDSWIRGAFGGRTLAGTVDVDPASASLVGTATTFSELGEGERLVLGDQVAKVKSVESDTALTLATAHYQGLAGATAYVAARGYRIDRPDNALSSVAGPYWTVSAGALGDYEPQIGRLGVNPQVIVAFFYEQRWEALTDDEGSWGALTQRVALRFRLADGVRLTVPRFDSMALARQAGSPFVAEGQSIIPTDNGALYVPSLALNWIGSNPEDTVLYPQRW